MKFKKISQKEQLVSNWSGGTTKQLFIFPENEVLANKAFDYRISSASIEIESSDFTPFPNHRRILMILKGELEIDHKGHYSKLLQPYQTDTFQGNWETSSNGKVVDFNLIFKPELDGELNVLQIDKNPLQINADTNLQFYGFYILEGSFAFQNDSSENRTVTEGELIILEQIEFQNSFQISGIGKLIEIKIKNRL